MSLEQLEIVYKNNETNLETSESELETSESELETTENSNNVINVDISNSFDFNLILDNQNRLIELYEKQIEDNNLLIQYNNTINFSIFILISIFIVFIIFYKVFDISLSK